MRKSFKSEVTNGDGTCISRELCNVCIHKSSLVFQLLVWSWFSRIGPLVRDRDIQKKVSGDPEWSDTGSTLLPTLVHLISASCWLWVDMTGNTALANCSISFDFLIRHWEPFFREIPKIPDGWRPYNGYKTVSKIRMSRSRTDQTSTG